LRRGLSSRLSRRLARRLPRWLGTRLTRWFTRRQARRVAWWFARRLRRGLSGRLASRLTRWLPRRLTCRWRFHQSSSFDVMKLTAWVVTDACTHILRHDTNDKIRSAMQWWQCEAEERGRHRTTRHDTTPYYTTRHDTTPYLLRKSPRHPHPHARVKHRTPRALSLASWPKHSHSTRAQADARDCYCYYSCLRTSSLCGVWHRGLSEWLNV
jgi:hypothetical protein